MEERLEELIGGEDTGMEVDEFSGEHNLHGVEVHVEHRGAVPEVDW